MECLYRYVVIDATMDLMAPPPERYRYHLPIRRCACSCATISAIRRLNPISTFGVDAKPALHSHSH